MNHNNRKIILIALLIALLLGNTWQLHKVRQELAALHKTVHNESLQMQSSNSSNLQLSLDRQSSHIEELLNKQASIFSQTSIDIALQDGKLAVTLTAIPKELKNNETLIAYITADGKTYQQQADSNGQAVFFIEPTEWIQPSFRIQSPTGVRQEVLDEAFVNDFISGNIYADWNDDWAGDTTYLDITLDLADQPFNAEQIAETYCIVVNTDISENHGGTAPDTTTVPLDETGLPKGDKVTVTQQANSTAESLLYRVDLSAYTARHDGMEYQVYFVLTTTDGTIFATTDDMLACFQVYEQGGSADAYDTILQPISA